MEQTDGRGGEKLKWRRRKKSEKSADWELRENGKKANRFESNISFTRRLQVNLICMQMCNAALWLRQLKDAMQNWDAETSKKEQKGKKSELADLRSRGMRVWASSSRSEFSHYVLLLLEGVISLINECFQMSLAIELGNWIECERQRNC